MTDRRRDEGKERESEVWGWSDGENRENEKRESGGALRLWQAGCSLNWWRRVWSSTRFNAPAEDRTAEQCIRQLAAITCYRGKQLIFQRMQESLHQKWTGVYVSTGDRKKSDSS